MTWQSLFADRGKGGGAVSFRNGHNKFVLNSTESKLTIDFVQPILWTFKFG